MDIRTPIPWKIAIPHTVPQEIPSSGREGRGRHGSFCSYMGVQVKLRNLLTIRAIPERSFDEVY